MFLCLLKKSLLIFVQKAHQTQQNLRLSLIRKIDLSFLIGPPTEYNFFNFSASTHLLGCLGIRLSNILFLLKHYFVRIAFALFGYGFYSFIGDSFSGIKMLIFSIFHSSTLACPQFLNFLLPNRYFVAYNQRKHSSQIVFQNIAF